MILRLLRALLPGAITLIALTACDGAQSSPLLKPPPPGTLLVVSSLPSKGIYREDTALTRRAIDRALATFRADAGVSLEHVALEGGTVETGEWTTAIEEANARAVAAEPSVIAYIGPHNSGAAGVALPITSRAGLLTTSPSATWPGLTVPGWDAGEPDKYFPTGARNFVRLSPPDVQQAVAAADWADADGRDNVLVLHDGSSYSEAMARAFAEDISSMVGEPTALSTAFDDIELPDLEGYDAVFVAPSSVQSAGHLAVALSESALPVYSTDVALDPQFFDLAGESASNWSIVSNGTGAVAQELGALYADTPMEAADQRPALNAFVVTRLVVEAVQEGATDRSAVLSYVRGKRLAGGRPLFDESGDPTVWRLTGYQMAEGVFQPVREFEQ